MPSSGLSGLDKQAAPGSMNQTPRRGFMVALAASMVGLVMVDPPTPAAASPTAVASPADDSVVSALIDDPASLTRAALDTVSAESNPTLAVSYNRDGLVVSTTENGIVTTFTYNATGTVATLTRGGVTRAFTYDAGGKMTGTS